MKIKDSFTDRLFRAFCYFVVAIIVIICIYPLWLVIVYSISDPDRVNAGKVFLLPQGINLDGYRQVFRHKDLMSGYWNTITQTLAGLVINMGLTIPAAYALSKPSLNGRKFFTTMIVFTMYFSGGLIPSFINMRNLGLLNNWWVIPLTGAVSSYNLIVARTFFASGVPRELEEAAEIDGCGTAGTFFRIVLPLSKAMMGVILLYYTVAHWNNYTTALYYMPATNDYWPLQMVIRKIMQDVVLSQSSDDPELIAYYSKIYNMIKYAVIVVSSLPVLILYPFLQKYFDKGVMLGSVKG
ncbi:MAG: carbohydrate ABC transporter permease [Clostridia bacterium]|nr:carbohydrate ABC transporter permease [Clostridia bacterium]